MAKQRKFSPEFKAKIALAALQKEATTSELCRKHQLSDTVISRWKVQLLKSAHHVFASTTPDDAQRQRIEDLERLIGQLTVELDAAKNSLRCSTDPRSETSARSTTSIAIRREPVVRTLGVKPEQLLLSTGRCDR